MSDPHGRFVWYELMTPDPDGATRFYPNVVGWGTRRWDGPTPYTMWANGETTIGGVWGIDEYMQSQGVQPHWLPYIGVRDVDATAAQAARLGAMVVREPADIPDVGRFAVLRDPQGAVFAIFGSSRGQPPMDEAPPRVGDVSWHELLTTDHAAAFDFYHQLFGWEKTSDFDMGAMGTYQMYGKGDRTYGGMFDKTPDMPVPPNWLCYVKVDDVSRAVEAVTRNGGTVINGPMEVPGGDWIAQCVDPQGAPFALHGTR
ncbi:MAG TPA: VOC family protein [Gemmatimonadaceae bacterium]|nr:VOC family protein [Gemmatimonadaceae bacterium]